MKNYKVQMTSTRSMDLGSTPQAYDVSAWPIMVDLEVMLMDADFKNILADKIQAMLQTFNANRGYTSTTNTAVINNYITLSLEAYATFVALKRSQDASALRDSQGMDISLLLTKRPAIQAFNNRMKMASAFTANGAGLIDDKTNINNAQWLRDYVGELTKIFLPPWMISFITELFSGMYVNPYNAASYVVAYPKISTWGSRLDQNFATAINGLQNNLNTYPDLVAILNLLGFVNPNLDFTRDLSGNTAIIFEDPSLILAIENSGDIQGYQLDDDVNELYRVPTNMNEFNFETQLEVDVMQFFKSFLFKGHLTSSFNTVNGPTPITTSAILIRKMHGQPDAGVPIVPANCILDYTNSTGIGTVGVDSLENFKGIYSCMVGIDGTFARKVSMSMPGGAYVEANLGVTNIVSEGVDIWFYPQSTARALRYKILADLVLGLDFLEDLKKFNDLWQQNAIII